MYATAFEESHNVLGSSISIVQNNIFPPMAPFVYEVIDGVVTRRCSGWNKKTCLALSCWHIIQCLETEGVNPNSRIHIDWIHALKLWANKLQKNGGPWAKEFQEFLTEAPKECYNWETKVFSELLKKIHSHVYLSPEWWRGLTSAYCATWHIKYEFALERTKKAFYKVLSAEGKSDVELIQEVTEA